MGLLAAHEPVPPQRTPCCLARRVGWVRLRPAGSGGLGPLRALHWPLLSASSRLIAHLGPSLSAGQLLMGACLSASTQEPRELEAGVEYFFTCGRGDDATWRVDEAKASCDLVVVLAADGSLSAENTGTAVVFHLLLGVQPGPPAIWSDFGRIKSSYATPEQVP